MKKIVLLSIAGILSALFAQTHQPPTWPAWYKEAVQLYNLDEPTHTTDSTALSLFLKTAAASSDPFITVQSLIKAGNIHQGYQRYRQANSLYHRALGIQIQDAKKKLVNYEAWLYLGSSLYFSNVIDSAQHYFEEAANIAFHYNGKERLPEQDRLYNSLGAIYYESANYQQAKNYFERSLQFSDKLSDDYEEVFTGVQSNIANCLMKLNQYDSALRIFRALKPVEQQRNIILQNTAHSYFELKQYDSALAIYRSLPLQNNFSSVIALTDMGRIYMMRDQWQMAEIVFDSAIAHNKSFSAGIKNKEEALAYLYRSQLAAKQGLLDEAITWNNEALQEVHLHFTWKNITDLPEEVSKTVSPITLFHILHTKGQLLRDKFRQSGQSPLLKGSLAAYRKAIETANFIKMNFDNDEAKLFFNENNRRIYTEAIEVAYEAAQSDARLADDYLFIIEHYKGNVLYQNLQNVLLKSGAQVPDSIRRREKEIKQLLAFYTSRANQSSDPKDAQQLQERLLSLQVELSRVQKTYERDAAYNLYKYQQTKVNLSIAGIQKQLDKNTALINYFFGDSSVYCLVINKSAIALKKINTDIQFHEAFANFTSNVYDQQDGKRFEGFASSQNLYRYLLQPVEEETKKYENWVIIPDGILYHLPFNALVKNEANKDYLLLSHTISYHYSFALLLEKNTHHSTEKESKGILAFAPFTDTGTHELPSLPYSAEELTRSADHIYAGDNATKANFLQKNAQYPVIHLATHASLGADSSTSWIQFYPGDSSDINNKLFLHEIYNLDLHQAELIILSACQTGGGVSTSGDGLLSISRAFMYAGADGIVSTLWKTEDRVTAYIMQRMHHYIGRQYPPVKALQLARIDLLKNDSLGVKYKTPNYWANFIYMGKMHEPAKKKWPLAWMAVFFGLAVIAATATWLKSRN